MDSDNPNHSHRQLCLKTGLLLLVKLIREMMAGSETTGLAVTTLLS